MPAAGSTATLAAAPDKIRVPRSELTERFVQIPSPWRPHVTESVDAPPATAAPHEAAGDGGAAPPATAAPAAAVPVIDLLNRTREGSEVGAASRVSKAPAQKPALPQPPAEVPMPRPSPSPSLPPPPPSLEHPSRREPWAASPGDFLPPAAATDVLRSIHGQQSQMQALQETIAFAAAEQSAQQTQVGHTTPRPA